MQQTLIVTQKVTFHMLLVTHVHVTSTSMVSQVTRDPETVSPFGYKTLFKKKKVTMQTVQSL